MAARETVPDSVRRMKTSELIKVLVVGHTSGTVLQKHLDACAAELDQRIPPSIT